MYSPGKFLEGVRETTNHISQDSWYVVRDLNPELSKYEGKLDYPTYLTLNSLI
jgi:hypothetical protein